MNTIAEIYIAPDKIEINSTKQDTSGDGMDMLNAIYRGKINDYPKYFKMDGLCKLGFIATELLLKSTNENRFESRDDRAVILFNRSGSISADTHYQETISDPENFYPSPSIFVYTLPNIVTGEIAIRNKYLGETSFYVTDHCDEDTIYKTMTGAFSDKSTTSVLIGWLDFLDNQNFEAHLKIVTK